MKLVLEMWDCTKTVTSRVPILSAPDKIIGAVASATALVRLNNAILHQSCTLEGTIALACHSSDTALVHEFKT